MPKGNPEGYLTDAAKAKVKKAKKEHKKAHGELLRAAEAAGLGSMAGVAVGAAAKKVRKTAKDAGCPSDVGRKTDKAREFKATKRKFVEHGIGGRLRD